MTAWERVRSLERFKENAQRRSISGLSRNSTFSYLMAMMFADISDMGYAVIAEKQAPQRGRRMDYYVEDKGISFCFELKSSAADCNSGMGLNFVCDYNFLVVSSDAVDGAFEIVNGEKWRHPFKLPHVGIIAIDMLEIDDKDKHIMTSYLTKATKIRDAQFLVNAEYGKAIDSEAIWLCNSIITDSIVDLMNRVISM